MIDTPTYIEHQGYEVCLFGPLPRFTARLLSDYVAAYLIPPQSISCRRRGESACNLSAHHTQMGACLDHSIGKAARCSLQRASKVPALQFAIRAVIGPAWLHGCCMRLFLIRQRRAPPCLLRAASCYYIPPAYNRAHDRARYSTDRLS